jgi:hypothetical protein
MNGVQDGGHPLARPALTQLVTLACTPLTTLSGRAAIFYCNVIALAGIALAGLVAVRRAAMMSRMVTTYASGLVIPQPHDLLGASFAPGPRSLRSCAALQYA